MPFYCFECEECGHVNEDFYPVDDRPNVVCCVHCGGVARFVIVPSNVHFNHTEKEVRIPSNPTSVWMGGKRGNKAK